RSFSTSPRARSTRRSQPRSRSAPTPSRRTASASWRSSTSTTPLGWSASRCGSGSSPEAHVVAARVPQDLWRKTGNPHATPACASSLQHLGVDYLDSYVLHGPSVRHGLSAEDWETWEAMERLHGAGSTRLLGVSNVNVGQLAELYAGASTKPAIVQNRCFAAMGWDRAVRQFCGERDILYQGFSLLTANREVLRHRRVHEIASRTGRTVPQVIFRFALQAGMTALTGTTSAPHMAEDLSVYDFELQPGEVRAIEELVA